MKVALDGTVYVGSGLVKLTHPPGTRLTLCEHPDGSFTLLANQFGLGKPIVVRRLEVAHPTWRV